MSSDLAATRAAEARFEIRQKRVPGATAPKHVMAPHDLAVAPNAPGLHNVPGSEVFESESGANLAVLNMFPHVVDHNAAEGRDNPSALQKLPISP
jgi:hypothetical protein